MSASKMEAPTVKCDLKKIEFFLNVIGIFSIVKGYDCIVNTVYIVFKSIKSNQFVGFKKLGIFIGLLCAWRYHVNKESI